ncbi:MAG: hypothetical protein JWR16_1946 [Nevskia sp.]|nr:hypothetical protein [Nevskia sp.]
MTFSTAARSHSSTVSAQRLSARVVQVRSLSRRLAKPLSPEDCGAQSMPDASPVKWHLAHTTWFFETFLLRRYVPGYRVFDERYGLLFNSYYEALGPRHPRPLRGLLTRPSLDSVLAYRAQVDAALGDWLSSGKVNDEALALIELGLHHERQHQELLLTDVKHLLFQNPLQPAYRSDLIAPHATAAQPLRFHDVAEGRIDIGHDGDGFAFDNESPRHTQWLQPHRIADRPVSNAEYRAFIRDGGYRRAEFWLSDGWAIVQTRDWQRPLYWNEDLSASFTLAGIQPLAESAPVCHVSYYEADAYARWAGARLPTEVEWEVSAATLPISGNFVDSDLLQATAPAETQELPRLRQFFGDVWEWTGSAYLPYPGFRIAPGAVGEYNGKFMNNQMVLRGGSCVSHADHLRASYRNFFYADARWQFSGIRLAQDTR